MWPLDGGLYLGTGDAVVTQCPETGRINVGTYRMMIKGPREIGVYTSPGKDATLDREKWWKLGKPMPIAAAYGIDPLLFLVAATSFPKTESEYEYYGGINGAPIELFKSDVTGLPLPARAEIILEGFVYPDETFAEGPFGEFTGYYGRPSGATPYMRVEKVRFRNNPTLTCALMADGPANEAGLFWAALRSAAIWSDLQKLGVPGIQGVWSIPEAAGWGITVVSIKQMYPGHAPQAMALAAQCVGGAYFGKYVIVVDDDIDPSNVHQVLWAMATRSRPAQSIDILRETWSTFLDPSLNPPEIRPWGSKALINACMDYRHIKNFSKRTKLSKATYEQVVARWNELGFSGTPPVQTVFEDSAPGTKRRVSRRKTAALLRGGGERSLPAFHIAVHPAQAALERGELACRYAGDRCRFVIARDRNETRHQRLPLWRKLDHDFAVAVGRSGARDQAHADQAAHQPRQGRGFDARQIGEVDLALATIARQDRQHAPLRDAQAVTRQRIGAELLGDDGADPVDQIGQVIAEIDLGRGFRGRHVRLN